MVRRSFSRGAFLPVGGVTASDTRQDGSQQRLVEEKPYNHRFMEEATLRLVGRVEMQKGLAPHPHEAAEVPERYPSCGVPLRSTWGLNSKLSSPAHNTRARNRYPHNIWL